MSYSSNKTLQSFTNRLGQILNNGRAVCLAELALSETTGDCIRLLHVPASSSGAPKVMLSAGIHGDEPAGPLAILEMLENGSLDKRIEWFIFPLQNPGGFDAGTRDNPQGIDLNRDFKKGVTPEVRFFIRQLLVMPALDLHLSLHEDWEYGQSYLYEINTGPLPSFAQELLKVVDACTGIVSLPLIDGHVPASPGLIVHHPEADEPEGWPEAIFIVKQQPLLSYTLETTSQAGLSKRIYCHCQVIRTCAERLVSFFHRQ